MPARALSDLRGALVDDQYNVSVNEIFRTWRTHCTEHVTHLRQLIVERGNVQRVRLRVALRIELFRSWHVISEHNVYCATYGTRTGQRGIE